MWSASCWTLLTARAGPTRRPWKPPSFWRADPEALETAKLLAEETGATYPFLIPDAGLMNGLLTGVQAVPTSFFVDSDGNLVGNVYTGSRSLEDWTEIVNQELEALEAAQ